MPHTIRNSDTSGEPTYAPPWCRGLILPQWTVAHSHMWILSDDSPSRKGTWVKYGCLLCQRHMKSKCSSYCNVCKYWSVAFPQVACPAAEEAKFQGVLPQGSLKCVATVVPSHGQDLPCGWQMDSLLVLCICRIRCGRVPCVDHCRARCPCLGWILCHYCLLDGDCYIFDGGSLNAITAMDGWGLNDIAAICCMMADWSADNWLLGLSWWWWWRMCFQLYSQWLPPPPSVVEILRFCRSRYLEVPTTAKA